MINSKNHEDSGEIENKITKTAICLHFNIPPQDIIQKYKVDYFSYVAGEILYKYRSMPDS